MKKVLISLLSAFLIFTFSNVSVQAAPSVDSLKVGITKDENALNPYTYVTGYPGLDLVNLLYDNLFHLDENNQPIPWLVKDYTESEDGLTYSFVLHENVKWHDDEPLTANDVKFTMDYFVKYPKSRFTNPLSQIKSINVSSDTEFSLTLSEPDPNFMIQPLADLPILPEHIWSSITAPDDEINNLGSGPYKFVEHKSGQYYKFEANLEYFKGEPQTKEIIFPIIEDTTAMFNALQAGELDAISASISPELVEQFESNNAIKVARGPGYSTTLFQVNAEKYPMSETPFRKAIDLAIDKQYLVDTVLLGYAEVGSPGFIHPSSPAHNTDLKVSFNVDEAIKTLADAGFVDTNGDGFVEGQNGETIDLTTLVYSGNPIRIRTAELVSEALNKIGIKNQVKAMDATTVDSLMWPDFDVSKGRDYDMGLWSWSNIMQLFPDRMVELFHSDPTIGSVNIGGYKSEEFDELSQQLMNTFEEEERMKIIKDMQAFVSEDAPFTTLYYQEIVNAYNPEVFDQYVFQVGKGIINKMSFVSGDWSGSSAKADDQEEVVEDNEEASIVSEDDEGGNMFFLYILAGVVVAFIVYILFIRKRKTSDTKDEFEV